MSGGIVGLGELAEAEVGDDDVAFLVEENVLRLHIPVEDIVLVEMADAHNHLRDVEPCAVLAETVTLLQVVEERSPREKLHSEIQLPLGLERELQAAEKRMTDFLQNLPLATRVFHLLLRQHATLH